MLKSVSVSRNKDVVAVCSHFSCGRVSLWIRRSAFASGAMSGKGRRSCRAFLLTMLYVCSAMCHTDTYRCMNETFFQTAEYYRDTDFMRIQLRTYSTSTCALVENGHLVVLFPWMNISDAEPEVNLARFQSRSLLELAAAFPNVSFFRIDYNVGDTTELINIWLDTRSVTFHANVSHPPKHVRGIVNADELRPYAGHTNFTTLLRSKSTILRRWRKVCEETFVRDVKGDVDMSYVYFPWNETLKCYVRVKVPSYFSVRLTCEDNGTWVIPPWGVRHRDMKGQTIVWTNPSCNVSVKCVYDSEDWSKELLPTVIHEDGARACAIGANAFVPVAVIMLLSALSAYGLYRYRASLLSRREYPIDYVRILRGQLFSHRVIR